MIIDGLKFTEIPSGNKSVVTFQRKVFENLKPLIDSFEVGVIHEISFDDENITHKMYTEPMTFSVAVYLAMFRLLLPSLKLRDSIQVLPT